MPRKPIILGSLVTFEIIELITQTYFEFIEYNEDDLLKLYEVETCYNNEEKILTPNKMMTWLQNEGKNNKEGYGASYKMWEWYAGSSSLSRRAAFKHVPHLPPIDFRWMEPRKVDEPAHLALRAPHQRSRMPCGCPQLFSMGA